MQKKLIALAVAAAFSAPAFADNANITFYGKAILDIESVKNDKIVAPATNKSSALRILNNASRFGLKGNEDIGDDLKAIYQYEVEMDASGNAGNGLGKTRNSGVGLDGGFGKVIVGIWDSPFKVAHNAVELFDNTTSFSATNLIGHAGGAGLTGVAAAGGVAAGNVPGDSNYNTRQKNMIQYWTPKFFGGLQGAISYSPDAAPTTTTNKSVLSMSATYDQDAIYASLGYENRADEVTAGTTDKALRLVGKYNFGVAWVGATVERITTNPSATVSYTQTNAELVGQYKFGVSTIALSYAKAGSTNLTNTGAKQVSLRYGYNFSKRTELFAAYTSLQNDTAGNYVLGNILGAAAQQTGSTQTVFGAGLIHSF